MRLLIVTQKVDQDDDVLGFFHRWIEKFAKHCEQVTVIALSVMDYDLPDNVRVFSLGKEGGVSRLKYLINFYRLIWRERKNYDAVFVHMNPIYVILGGVLWKIWQKRIGLWYTHKYVDLKLSIAEKLSHIIFTASRESFRLVSNKIKVMGHGIDVSVFVSAKKKRGGIVHIVTAGRISPVKDYETLINAVAVLVGENFPTQVNIVGGPVTIIDEDYFKNLYKLVREKHLEKVIHFVGPIPNKNLSKYLQEADIFINMSHTGSLDKAVLEAMACGLPVVTSNEAFGSVLGPDAPTLMFQARSIQECVRNIKGVAELSDTEYYALAGRLRTIIEKEHNIEMLIPRILSQYETSR